MSVDHDPHITSPPPNTCWHVKLKGDHNELEEALEHISFVQDVTTVLWEDEKTLVLTLQWADEYISLLLNREINSMWPDIQIIRNEEVEQCQMRDI